MQTQHLYLFLFTTLHWIAVPHSAYAELARETQVTFQRHEQTPWKMEWDLEGKKITFQHEEDDSVAFEISHGFPGQFGRNPGITPILNGQRLEGHFWGNMTPMLYPILEYKTQTVERLTLHLDDEILRARFEGGNYRELRPAASDEPFFMEIAVSIRDQQLILDLYGLYYILLPMGDASLGVETLTGTHSRSIRRLGDGANPVMEVREEETLLSEIPLRGRRHLEYFEAVTGVEVKAVPFPYFSFSTWVQRLQLQVDNSLDPRTMLFELDFDHSFKDRGQKAVISRLIFDLE